MPDMTTERKSRGCDGGCLRLTFCVLHFRRAAEAFQSALSRCLSPSTTAHAEDALRGSLHFGLAEAAEGVRDWATAELQYQRAAAAWGDDAAAAAAGKLPLGAMPALLRWERLVRADADTTIRAEEAVSLHRRTVELHFAAIAADG
jgi:hypothetical protein